MQNPIESEETVTGLTGTVRLMLALMIAMVAGLALLIVVDIVPLTQFGAIAGKVVLLTCIVGLASIAIGLITRTR